VEERFAQRQRGAPQETDQEGEELRHVLLCRLPPLPPTEEKKERRGRQDWEKTCFYRTAS